MFALIHFWKIGLEVVILWFAIYMMLLFVKGTRSEELLKGLVIVGLIFIATKHLGLDAINWTITRLFPISIIALVIVFQPELRRGLAQLGQFGVHQEDASIIDEVARSAQDMSKKKTGALIVIERESGLKSYIETGTAIDGKVTGYLINTIFMPLSPLHDGAVIIRGGRIVAAGCVLPLSQEEKGVPKYLGMRHRAAIGITEETDAVCLVVSEESGSISIASNGKLAHNIDSQILTKTLKSLFYKSSHKEILSKISSRIGAKNHQDRG